MPIYTVSLGTPALTYITPISFVSIVTIADDVARLYAANSVIARVRRARICGGGVNERSRTLVYLDSSVRLCCKLDIGI